MIAKITVEYICPNLCSRADLDDTGMTFEEMVRYLADSEGVIGMAEAEKIVKIERVDEEGNNWNE